MASHGDDGCCLLGGPLQRLPQDLTNPKEAYGLNALEAWAVRHLFRGLCCATSGPLGCVVMGDCTRAPQWASQENHLAAHIID
ncbi:hypothetical protein NDU88_005337 [Pleurodeles waltl]|uniref:Uncharacterized protein n=1 Tax=Pleurodeles waltl TaxID=8319 RepID=A0AAV7UIA5_PLEWA|nr:hypothetical protein NDU88_005337 [Pleurodeles waltl]